MAMALCTLGFILLLALGILALLCSSIFLGLWAYQDARDHNFTSPVAWGFIVALVPNFIGLIIYLIFRANHHKKIICMKCGVPNDASALYCRYCGAALAEDPATVNQLAPRDPRRAKRHLTGFFVCIGAGLVLIVIGVVLLITGTTYYSAHSSTYTIEVPLDRYDEADPNFDPSALGSGNSFGVGVIEMNTAGGYSLKFVSLSGSKVISIPSSVTSLSYQAKVDVGQCQLYLVTEDNQYVIPVGEGEAVTGSLAFTGQNAKLYLVCQDGKGGSFQFTWDR